MVSCLSQFLWIHPFAENLNWQEPNSPWISNLCGTDWCYICASWVLSLTFIPLEEPTCEWQESFDSDEDRTCSNLLLRITEDWSNISLWFYFNGYGLVKGGTPDYYFFFLKDFDWIIQTEIAKFTIYETHISSMGRKKKFMLKEISQLFPCLQLFMVSMSCNLSAQSQTD